MLGHLKMTLKEIIKTIHYMDIDSPRFVDYVTMQLAGLETRTLPYGGKVKPYGLVEKWHKFTTLFH